MLLLAKSPPQLHLHGTGKVLWNCMSLVHLVLSPSYRLIIYCNSSVAPKRGARRSLFGKSLKGKSDVTLGDATTSAQVLAVCFFRIY